MDPQTFAAVRPHDDWLRVRVFEFLESLGYTQGPGLLLPRGTPDAQAVAWIDSVVFSLLLLPFHTHRDNQGAIVDGIGVALLLSEAFAGLKLPILMPITDFSKTASFDRRFGELQEKRPEVAECVVVMPEAELGSAEIAARIREIAAATLG